MHRQQLLFLKATPNLIRVLEWMSSMDYTSENVNFNNWNLDLNYIWQFAPGSQLIAFYRNSIFNDDTNANLSFFENLNKLFEQSQKHTLSLRVVYFIDYNKIKKILHTFS